MVSSGTVLTDLDSFSTLSTSIYNQVSSIEGNWEGMSKDNQATKAKDAISTNKEAIFSQLSSFADALNLYERYKQSKQSLSNLKNNYQTAVNNQDASAANHYAAEINNLQSTLNSQKNEIDALLSNVKDISVPDVASLSLMRIPGQRGDFVNYYQYNYRESYGYGTTIASAGCGPTSMAMVLTAVTGDEVTPVEAANWSLQHGYRVEGNGTAWAYFDAIADAYGIECDQMGISSNNIISNLQEGKYVIASMGPGHFTKGGHFIVLTGISEDGRITVADPNSEQRSNQTWDVNTIVNEGKQIWAI